MSSDAATVVSQDVEADKDVDGGTELENALKAMGSEEIDDAGEAKTEDDKDATTSEEGKDKETGVEDPGEKSEKTEGDRETEADDPLLTENAALKSQLRELGRQMSVMNARFSRLSKRKLVPGEAKEGEGEDENPLPQFKDEEPTGVELLQSQLDDVGQQRGDRLAEMVELMALNPKYEDVEAVCTRDRFDDLFEEAAKREIRTHGGNQLEVQMALELDVWKMPNPYRYMYNMIKKYHPDYAKDTAAKPDNKNKIHGPAASAEAKERGSKIAATAASAFDVKGGGATNPSGWTAERIDNMPEEDLHKVPKEVYDKYLRGDLDPKK